MAKKKTTIVPAVKITEVDIKKDDVPRKDSVTLFIQRTKGDVAITVKKGKLSKRKEWIDLKFQGTWRRYFPNNFIKRTIVDKNGKSFTDYIVRFNLYYSEALKAGEDAPEYDQALENQKLNYMANQFKKAVGAVTGILSALARDRSIQLLVIMAAVFGIPIGMVLWPNLIATPTTIVHWIPRR